MAKKKYTQSQFKNQAVDERYEVELREAKKKATFEAKEKIAVVLVNFGGPQNYEEVKPFLYNLFSDPVIFNFPYAFLYRNALAWFISNMRDFNSRLMYKCVNGSSPLIPITFLQGEKLQQLFKRNNLGCDVFVSFRYCKPTIDEVLDDVKEKGYKKVVVLPLFPQYSFTTTGSVQLILDKWIKKNGKNLKIHMIKDWYKDEDYINSYVNMIERSLKNMDLRSTTILFSAHSIPEFNIDNGDPYKNHIEESAKLIIESLGWKKDWKIAYQSKLGPVKWLEPSTEVAIEELSKKSDNVNILVVPISFVCEHVETIYEIGDLYKEIALKCGIKRFRRVPALNTNKYLIQALYNSVIGCLKDNQLNVKELLALSN